MNHSEAGRSLWFLTLIVGIAFVNVALFLHPMNPEDFLNMAISDPLQSVMDAHGGNMAIFFWVSIALVLSSLCGLLTSARLLCHASPLVKPGMRAVRH